MFFNADPFVCMRCVAATVVLALGLAVVVVEFTFGGIVM